MAPMRENNFWMLAGRAIRAAGGLASSAAAERAREIARVLVSSAGRLRTSNSGGERYAAAKPTRLGESWMPVTKPINKIVTSEGAIQ